MKFRLAIWTAFIALTALVVAVPVVASAAPGSRIHTPTPTATAATSSTPTPTSTASGTDTPTPTSTASGTDTPAPTSTASGTSTPTPVKGITQTITSAPVTFSNGQTGTFTGTLQVVRFVNRLGRLYAVGSLTGTVTNATTSGTTSVNQDVSVQVTQATGSSTLLTLTLGSLGLSDLGLTIDLSSVQISITAQDSSNTLLGDLLTDAAKLLDHQAPLGSLAVLLNEMMRLIS